MAKDNTFFVVPTNEGQELNYVETHKGTFESAKKRSEQLAEVLDVAMIQGMIGCAVQNSDGEQIAYYNATAKE